MRRPALKTVLALLAPSAGSARAQQPERAQAVAALVARAQAR